MGILNMLSEFKNEQNRKNIYTTKNFSLVLIMHSYKYGDQLIICGFLILFYSIYMWWRDITREATLEEEHTFSVQRSLRLGMLLFIVSKLCFFLIFFGLSFIQVCHQRTTLVQFGHQKL